MASNRKPRAYVNDVPAEGTAPGIVYPPFHHSDIGARKSHMPAFEPGPGALQHVGSGSGKGK